MEKYVKYIIVATVVISVLFVTIILFWLIKKLRTKITSMKILKYGKKNEDFIYNLLRTASPKSRIIRNAYLPTSFNPENRRYSESDIILVDRGGVFVIEVKGHKGNIDNPGTGDWCQYYGEKKLEFRNPFDQNRNNIHAIEMILKREKIFNIPLHNIVVFTDENVKFHYKYNMLLKPGRLIGFLSDMNKNRFLTLVEINKTISAINKYAKKKHYGSNKPIKAVK